VYLGNGGVDEPVTVAVLAGHVIEPAVPLNETLRMPRNPCIPSVVRDPVAEVAVILAAQ
jgi:hypothetical protein